MIHEQDFIMTVRRLNRLTAVHWVMNVVFDQLLATAPDAKLKEQLQKDLGDFCHAQGGSFHLTTNGDGFVVFPFKSEATAAQTAANIIQVILPHADEASASELAKTLPAFRMPADYMDLRERVNVYLDAARGAETIGHPLLQPDKALQHEAVRGPLTAWSLSQLEKLIATLDISTYVRTQPAYERQANGKWQSYFEEFHIGVSDLRRERFPRLDFAAPERLFMEFSRTLDRRLLQQLTANTDHWRGKRISINLSVETVLSQAFAQFCVAVPQAARKLVGFEINRADLFMDFTTTQNVMSVLRDGGFFVIIDGLEPEILPYLNVHRFNADYYKISVGKDQITSLNTKECQEALAKLPPSSLIFHHCDSEAALSAGKSLGVTKFQGWLIDDLATQS